MDAIRLTSASDLTFNKDTFHDENPEISLVQWLSRCEQALHDLPTEDVKAGQVALELSLLSIAGGLPSLPSPGRLIRNKVARCFIILFNRGETRSLPDTLQTLSRIVNGNKSVNPQTQISCLFIMGEIMGNLGQQVVSFMGEVTAISLRVSKQSSVSIQLRYHALLALSKSLRTAARALSDATVKDIIKQAKNGLSDKALPVQRGSAEVLTCICARGRVPVTASEIETIVSTCVRGLETADQVTRRSLGDLVAHLLRLTQTEAAPQDAEANVSRKTSNLDIAPNENDDPSPRAPVDVPPSFVLKLPDMLNILSSWLCRQGTTRRSRVGVAGFYASLFIFLGPAFIEAHYSQIVGNLLNDVVAHPRNNVSRQEVLLIRRLVTSLIRDVIGVRMLSEQGQISAIKVLSTAYLRKWPALMPGQTEPSAEVLVIVLNEVAGLVQQLGNAPPPVQDALSIPLIELLGHPNYSTRVACAWALRVFCYSTPLRLAQTIINVVELLQRDITSIATPSASEETQSRIAGHSCGLAALVATIPRRPLYVSYDLSAKILDIAIQLLKRAGEHEIGTSGIEIETAWACIASLMVLGPNFVRAHLSQLLVLWRNALPKLATKDTSYSTTKADWGFLMRVKESALAAILNFLLHNSPTLVTLDVARRLSSLLSNALNFANAYVVQRGDDVRETSAAFADPDALTTREAMLRRRIFQCFSSLGFSTLSDSTQLALLSSTSHLFAGADGALGSSAQAAIASSSGTFVSVWQSADGYAYGLTSLNAAPSQQNGDIEQHGEETQDFLNRDKVDVRLDELERMPIIGSLEHDALNLCRWLGTESVPLPVAPCTGVIDAALELFSRLLVVQDLATTERFVSLVINSVRSPKLDRNSGRKAAAYINACTAFSLALHLGMQDPKHARDTFGTPQVTQILAPFLKDAIISHDRVLRSLGSEVLGQLAGVAGASFLSTQIASLVEMVVQNRDPNCRAGCSAAFGSIYNHVGGLATGPLLKTTVNVLMSLGNDPHPTVHFYALAALANVITAASLAFSPFISRTLGMLVKLFLLDSHEPEGGTLANANSRGDLPAYQMMCRIINAVIGVLGPELLESGKTRSLTLDLVHEFFNETDSGIRVESIRCMQHLLIFGLQFMPIPSLVASFRENLSSPQRPLKAASINALYAFAQKDAFALSRIGGDKLVEDLFGMLDDDASVDGVQGVITSWLRQTVVHSPSGWIDLCQRVMSKATAYQQSQSSESSAKAGTYAQDDEGAALSTGIMKNNLVIGEENTLTTSRWRTQLFAMRCLHLICNTVAEAGLNEHLDLRYARKMNANERALLVSRIPDLVKMAFTASAAYVTDIRLEGLVLLRDIIKIFSQSPDPDYSEALLLEQYQAPITSALIPAFSSDSTPEILASAIETCAIFVGCGVIKDATRMGRILKLLKASLQQSEAFGVMTIGDAQELSPNASIMLRVATLAAWAELEVSSTSRDYLQPVVAPHRHTLASLWVASLRDYASIRADTEVLQEGPSSPVDLAYTGLGRDVLLPYYTNSWIKILRAVAVAMQRDDPRIWAAMNGGETSAEIPPSDRRADGVALYPIMLGLVFEALSTNPADAVNLPTRRLSSSVALETLASLVRPEYSGTILFEPSTFSEILGLWYRLTLTETAEIQSSLVQTIVSLVKSRDSGTLRKATSHKAFLDDSPLTHCMRMCAYVLRSAINTDMGPSDARAALIRDGFSALMSIARAFEPSRREDARAVAVLLYSSLLKNEVAGSDPVGSCLPSLKIILEVESGDDVRQYRRVAHGLLSACLQNVEATSGREGPVPTLKLKNNLLAAVLVLTVMPPAIDLGRLAIEHCCSLVSEKLGESGDVVITAAHCVKTLVSAASGGLIFLQPHIKLLLPGVVTFFTNIAGRLRVGTGAGILSVAETQATEEVLKALNSLFMAFPETDRARALGVLLPTLILLLDPAQSPPSAVHSLVVSSLLTYASTASGAFKEVTRKLDSLDRETLETSVRQAVEGISATPAIQLAVKRQISLRTF